MLGLDNPTHILLVLVVLLLLFGAKRLPELGRGLGTSLREFKGGLATPFEGNLDEHASLDKTSVTSPAVGDEPADLSPPSLSHLSVD